jgi:arginine utilization regulatory protein
MKVISEQLVKILKYVGEGIHIVNSDGITVYYNEAMEKIEGIKKEKVINRHILDVYPNWKKENSTLLTALKTKRKILRKKQSYINLKGKKINTINTTVPLFNGTKLIGAVEISSNYTEVSNMSNQIIDLQQKLIKNSKVDVIKSRYYIFDDIIGKNVDFMKALRHAKKSANMNSSVLIFGETGTGKELFAQSIHSASKRKKMPFIAQNCAAIPDSLLEGILFGSIKGSFTGAENRPGLFEQASGGTLFLDEINSMSPELQAKLLRVLQENYIRRVGGQKDIRIDVRIIAATNTDPIILLKSNKFRKDLYYRINVVGIRLPTLNQREDDIAELAEYFINEFNKSFNKDVWMISEKVMELFKSYNWEGNIRELRNIIESSMNFVEDEHVIRKEHLPPYFIDKISGNIVHKHNSDFKDYEKLPKYLSDIEKNIMLTTYRMNNGNVTLTAKKLGISRQNLQYKLKKYM